MAARGDDCDALAVMQNSARRPFNVKHRSTHVVILSREDDEGPRRRTDKLSPSWNDSKEDAGPLLSFFNANVRRELERSFAVCATQDDRVLDRTDS